MHINIVKLVCAVSSVVAALAMVSFPSATADAQMLAPTFKISYLDVNDAGTAIIYGAPSAYTNPAGNACGNVGVVGIKLGTTSGDKMFQIALAAHLSGRPVSLIVTTGSSAAPDCANVGGAAPRVTRIEMGG